MNKKSNEIILEDKTFELHSFGGAEAPLIILLNFDKAGEEIASLVKDNGREFNLIEVTGLRWQDELSPWRHLPVFHGDPGYRGEGFAFLRTLAYVMVPEAAHQFGLNPSSIAIAGYSLAGMFALYAGSRSEAFDALLSVSGSLWFEGFVDFVKEQGIAKKVRYVYLSLGENEPRTKNKVLSTVGTKTEELRDYYLSQGVKTDFVWNEGGHFSDENKRIASAIIAYLNAF